MTITENEILTDIYNVIIASPINGLDGGVYKKTRPTDSELNDCVIGIIKGINGKFVQDGALYVKLFMPAIKLGTTFVEDTDKGQELERLLLDLSDTLLKMNGYTFYVQSRETYTEPIGEINAHQVIRQHFVILKMNFKYLN